MNLFKKIPTNYVTNMYVLNMLLSIFIAALEDNKPVAYAFSVLLLVNFGYGGYLNAKKGKKLKSCCWVFLFNLCLGMGSIYAIELLGATFNIFGGSKGGGSVLFVLFQYAINFYLAPFLLLLGAINESLSIILIVLCAFIIPFIGFKIGQNLKKTD